MSRMNVPVRSEVIWVVAPVEPARRERVMDPSTSSTSISFFHQELMCHMARTAGKSACDERGSDVRGAERDELAVWAETRIDSGLRSVERRGGVLTSLGIHTDSRSLSRRRSSPGHGGQSLARGLGKEIGRAHV